MDEELKAKLEKDNIVSADEVRNNILCRSGSGLNHNFLHIFNFNVICQFVLLLLIKWNVQFQKCIISNKLKM